MNIEERMKGRRRYKGKEEVRRQKEREKMIPMVKFYYKTDNGYVLVWTVISN